LQVPVLPESERLRRFQGTQAPPTRAFISGLIAQDAAQADSAQTAVPTPPLSLPVTAMMPLPRARLLVLARAR